MWASIVVTRIDWVPSPIRPPKLGDLAVGESPSLPMVPARDKSRGHPQVYAESGKSRGG
jgi:hypothetical protein